MEQRGEYEFANDVFADDVFRDLLFATGVFATAYVKAARTVERLLRRHVDAGSAEAAAKYLLLSHDALSSQIRCAFDPEYAQNMAIANHAGWYYDELLLESNI